MICNCCVIVVLVVIAVDSIVIVVDTVGAVALGVVVYSLISIQLIYVEWKKKYEKNNVQ